MLRCCHLLALVVVALFTPTISAQAQSAADTPLHLASNRFDFVAAGTAQPSALPIRVHNGGSERFTGVKLTRLTYADSSRSAAWLVVLSRQTNVAPDELATVGTLCVNAAGLAAGTYRATAAIAANEVPAQVAITTTLVVKDDGTSPPVAAARCASTDTK
jgi:hypothetical protein